MKYFIIPTFILPCSLVCKLECNILFFSDSGRLENSSDCSIALRRHSKSTEKVDNTLKSQVTDEEIFK